MDWGARGGPAARELALWVQLQREFRRRHLLPAEAIRRLDAVGFDWDPQVDTEDTVRVWTTVRLVHDGDR